jgi:hypothetical protein
MLTLALFALMVMLLVVLPRKEFCFCEEPLLEWAEAALLCDSCCSYWFACKLCCELDHISSFGTKGFLLNILISYSSNRAVQLILFSSQAPSTCAMSGNTYTMEVNAGLIIASMKPIYDLAMFVVSLS